jgi:hypothetical protein
MYLYTSSNVNEEQHKLYEKYQSSIRCGNRQQAHSSASVQDILSERLPVIVDDQVRALWIVTRVKLPERWSMELDVDPATISSHLCQIEKVNEEARQAGSAWTE